MSDRFTLALRTPGLATAAAGFVAQGLLDRTPLHVVDTLGTAAGEVDNDVLLGLAFTVRGPRTGHVGVDLARLRESIVAEAPDPAREDGADRPVARWPDPDGWLARVAASPLVGTTLEAARPFYTDGRLLYTHRFASYQARLADALRERAGRPSLPIDLARLRDDLRALFVPAMGSAAAAPDWQQIAVALAALRPLTIVTGGPGTGKTTTVARMLAALWSQRAGLDGAAPLTVAIAAPTGKAAVRVKQSIADSLEGGRVRFGDARDPIVRAFLEGIGPSTLHRLLGFDPRRPTRFRHGPGTPLPHDVVVVDEASMVDLPLMAKLAQALRPDARLVLVGDPDQLVSVEAGSVLADLRGTAHPDAGFAPPVATALAEALPDCPAEALSGTRPCASPLRQSLVHLRKPYRFAAGSSGTVAPADRPVAIGEAAHAIAALSHGGAEPDEATVDRRIAEARRLLFEGDPALGYASAKRFDPTDDGLPTAESLAAAVDHYDRALDLLTGPPSDPRTDKGPEKAPAERQKEALRAFESFRVLCAHRKGPLGVEGLNRAIAEALAKRRPTFRPASGWYLGRPVLVTQNDYFVGRMNGDLGLGVWHKREPSYLFLEAGGPVWLPAARMPAHQTCFAMTIHKSQGSEFREALIVLGGRRRDNTALSPILTRELVYTALTRAKHRVAFLATDDVLDAALRKRITRASGLGALLGG